MNKEEPVISPYSIDLFGLELNFRIAVIADLHDKKYPIIVNQLNDIDPDIILFVGDTLERNQIEHIGYYQDSINNYHGRDKIWRIASKVGRVIDKAVISHFINDDSDDDSPWGYELLERASEIAPVYLSVGNHEWYFTDEDKLFFKERRITLLDNEDVCLDTPFGTNVLIGGLSTKYDMHWLNSYSRKNGVKILMCHHPEYYFNFIKGTDTDKFHLIISGHCHGGQIRLKTVLGNEIALFAPGQGFFPKHVHGKEYIGNHNESIVISSGVSRTTSLPRWGNPREIVVINLS